MNKDISTHHCVVHTPPFFTGDLKKALSFGQQALQLAKCSSDPKRHPLTCFKSSVGNFKYEYEAIDGRFVGAKQLALKMDFKKTALNQYKNAVKFQRDSFGDQFRDAAKRLWKKHSKGYFGSYKALPQQGFFKALVGGFDVSIPREYGRFVISKMKNNTKLKVFKKKWNEKNNEVENRVAKLAGEFSKVLKGSYCEIPAKDFQANPPKIILFE
jgi:hypothetical protein